jgi:hypothetical protein
VATRGACVAHMCRVARLLHWIWVTFVRCCHSVEVLFHHVHMRLMVRFKYDYLVVEINDTKKWLIELLCMLSIGC